MAPWHNNKVMASLRSTLRFKSPQGQNVMGQLDGLRELRGPKTSVPPEFLQSSLVDVMHSGGTIPSTSQVTILSGGGDYTLDDSKYVGTIKTVVSSPSHSPANPHQMCFAAGGRVVVSHGRKVSVLEGGTLSLFCECHSALGLKAVCADGHGWVYMFSDEYDVVDGVGMSVRKHVTTGETQDLGILCGVVKDCAVREDGTALFVCGSGVRLSSCPGTFTLASFEFDSEVLISRKGLSSEESFNSACVDSHSRVYVGGGFTSFPSPPNGGLSRLDEDGQWRGLPFPGGSVIKVCSSGDVVGVFGMFGGGFAVISDDSLDHYPMPFAPSECTWFQGDGSGGIWVRRSNGELWKWTSGSWSCISGGDTGEYHPFLIGSDGSVISFSQMGHVTHVSGSFSNMSLRPTPFTVAWIGRVWSG